MTLGRVLWVVLGNTLTLSDHGSSEGHRQSFESARYLTTRPTKGCTPSR